MTGLLVIALAIPTYTPGEVRPLTTAQVCAIKWGTDRRHVDESLKRRIMARYGYPWETHDQYEFDHLIPRSLAGADSVENVWPQPWAQAHLKDPQEVRLSRAVCRGEIALPEAQDQMRQWGRWLMREVQ